MNSTPNPFVRCTVIASISLCLLTTGCNAGSSPSPQTSSSQATSQEVPTPSPSTPSPNGSSAADTGTSTSPEPSTWPDVVAQVQSGVGQLTVTTCDAGYTGTGFLVGPDLVVTAAHVVRDASAISIAFGRTSVDATVLGKNDVADIAVVKPEALWKAISFNYEAASPQSGATWPHSDSPWVIRSP